MDRVETLAELNVELVWSPCAGEVRQRWLRVPVGCTLEQALRGCAEFDDQWECLGGLKIGIWGRQRPPETLLRERDRIEVYRPLTVDPMEARRQRYRDRGERIVSRHRPLAGKTTSR